MKFNHKYNIGDIVKVVGSKPPRGNFLPTIIDIDNAIVSVCRKGAVTLSYEQLYGKNIVCYKVQWPQGLGITWEFEKDLILKFSYDSYQDYKDKIDDRM